MRFTRRQLLEMTLAGALSGLGQSSGTFTETGKGSDIGKSMGKALGVVAADLNNDGLMDLFVANNTARNFLYMNRSPNKDGKWKFEEIALPAGVAYSAAAC